MAIGLMEPVLADPRYTIETQFEAIAEVQ